MPWGMDPRSASYGAPFGAPRYSSALTLADLYTPPPPRPAYPAPPTIPSSYGEMGDQAKKDLRREAILRFAQALAAPNGRIGEGLAAAAGGLSDWKAQQLDQARATMEHDYAAGVKSTDLEAARAEKEEDEEQRRLHAQGRLELVRAIADREPELASQAEAAARSGDETLLRETAKEADRRARARAAGQDPNDPFADERTKAQIANEAWAERQRIGKEKGYATYFDEPGLSVEEIEARAAAAARGQRSVWGDRNRGGAGGEDGLTLRTSGGLVGEVVEEDGRRVWKPLPGQESLEAGEWRTYVDEDTQQRVRINDATGEKRPVDDRPARSASQVLIDIEATLGRKLTAEERTTARSDYLRGGRPRDIVAGLRVPKRITAPASAPTQGQPPKPKAGQKSGPPPKQVQQRAESPDLARLKAEATQKWQRLPESEKKSWGSYERYLSAAVTAAKAAGRL